MKKNNNIHKVFLGCITKKGKKIVAQQILNNAFAKVSSVTKYSSFRVMKSMVSKLDSIVEVKSVRIRKNTFLVPTPVNSKRRNYLIVKKILESVKGDTTNRPAYEKIGDEIISVLTQKSSKSIVKKNLITKQAILNRSNSHYRW
jgi:small subunit ribosomal protein S7